MELINEQVQQYAERYTTAEDALLKEIAEYTYAHHPQPHMLSGHLQGKLLEMISCMIRPRRILEIGTFMGYSALCLAKGLQPNGVVHTIELRQETARIAKQYFERSSYPHQIILHVGDALSIIEQLQEDWDLVFIDADKPGYIDYFNHVLPKVRKDGFILADNVLFHGQVLAKEITGKSAKAIQAFNDYIQSRTDVEKMILPVRDGIYLIRKIS